MLDPYPGDATYSPQPHEGNGGKARYVLRLYMIGATPDSARVLANLKSLCEDDLNGRFRLEVIDILRRPTLANGEQIMAPATVVKLLPVPVRRSIANLSGAGGRLFGLDVQTDRKRPRT